MCQSYAQLQILAHQSTKKHATSLIKILLKISRNSMCFASLSVQLVFLRVLCCCLRLRPIRTALTAAAALIIACLSPLQIADRAC